MDLKEHNSEFIEFDPHSVDHGSTYHKMGWSAFKGHLRGIIRGLVVGCTVGAGIGLALSGLLAVPALAAVMIPAGATIPAVSTLVGGVSLFSGLLAGGLMGRIGNASGNVAAQLAELELRERYPEIQEVSPDSPEPGFGHHYQIPADRDQGKLFHPRVGFTGAMLGGGIGGLAGLAGLTSLHSLHIFALGSAAAPVLAPVLIGAAVGSAFGISRSHFKSIFNFTDSLMQGKLTGPSQAELEKDRERWRHMGEDGPPSVITSLQRQEEFYRLENEYFKRGFEAGFAGNGRGLVGGAVAGSLVGILVGGAIIGALSLAAVPLAAGGTVAIMGASIAFSMHKSIEFFTEAFFEASAHGHVHELHHERMRAMRKGINLSFADAEQNIIKRRQADPELTPPEAQEKKAFNPKVALIMGALGAVAGLGLAPLATGVATMFGMAHGVTGGLGAALFGLTGTAFGLGPKITEGLHGFADKIYHGTFNPGDNHPDIKVEGKIPLMSPRSELAEHFSKHLLKNMPEIEYNNEVAPEYAQDSAVAPAYAAQAQESSASRSVQNILEKGSRSFTDKVKNIVASPEGVQR